jgi:hypothetical protein
MYLCPVCGYERLEDPPKDFTICPSCGTEFGYDDAFSSHAELRAKWLRNGAPWWSRVDPRPENWDPQQQVDAVMSSISALLKSYRPSSQEPTPAFRSFMNAQRGQPGHGVFLTTVKQTLTAQTA